MVPRPGYVGETTGLCAGAGTGTSAKTTAASTAGRTAAFMVLLLTFHLSNRTAPDAASATVLPLTGHGREEQPGGASAWQPARALEVIRSDRPRSCSDRRSRFEPAASGEKMLT